MINELKRNWKKYSGSMAGIVIPAVLAIILYFIFVFIFIIPSARNNLLEEKKQHVRELTETSWGVLYAYYCDELFGFLPKDSAQKYAIDKLAKVRYGTDKKDYYWIIDTTPVMIMHPYRKDLVGKYVGNFKDEKGKRLFQEAKQITSESGEGYIRYMWQWQDDSLKIEEKISFVKIFKPWGWIIGTGIYLNDIRSETKKLTRNTIEISLAIFIFVLLLMFFLIRHALKIEISRQLAEKEKKVTFEKYKALAEANPEGVIMVFEDLRLNLNKNMQRLLGYKDEDIPHLHIHDIISQQQIDRYLGDKYLRYLMLGVAEPKNFEAHLRRKDGSFINMFVNCSRIIIEDRLAVVISAKDIMFEEFARKQIGLSREKYKDLLDIVHIGLFRISSLENPDFLEVNRAFGEILGFNFQNEIFSFLLKDFFLNQNEWEIFEHYIILSGFIKNFQVRMKSNNGSELIAELSAVKIHDNENNDSYIEGMIIDKSGEARKILEKENLMLNLKSSSYLLHQPLKTIARKVVFCDASATTGQLIETMQINRTDAILVKKDNNFIGIITDHDLRDRVLAQGLGKDVYAEEVLTTPLICLPESALVHEALLKMQEKRINHLPVTGDNQSVTGIVSVNDILQLQQNSASVLILTIQNSKSPEEWTDLKPKLHTLCKMYIHGGSKYQTITDLITNVSDAVVEKLCIWAENELGKPPVKYSFLAIGSQGRRELTLKTDQDNALVFENVEISRLEEVKKYFLQFSQYICYGLDKAGFDLCPGDLMAMNPKWCLSLQEWKALYTKWIISGGDDERFEYTAFFDVRNVFGDASLISEIKNHIANELYKSKILLQLLISDISTYKTQVNVFGKIITEKTDRHPSAFNIKTSIAHITNLVRILSLKFQLNEINTSARLESLANISGLDKLYLEELDFAYNWLMLLRIKNQLDAIEKNAIPDNFIDPRYLSEIEYDTTRKILDSIAKAGKKLKSIL